MSIFDELLVAIDDQAELRMDQLEALFPQYSRTVLAAALGRLSSRNWIEKVTRGITVFRVSSLGNAYLNQILEAIHKSEVTWPESWFVAAVLLPDKNRQVRDRLRHYFISQGYGLFLDGLWIYPWNRQAELSSVLVDYGAAAGVIMFETKPLGQATNQLLIQTAWNWSVFENNLQKLIFEIRSQLNGLSQLAKEVTSPEARLRLRLAAKSIVFKYGQLLNASPNLPDYYSPARTLQSEARALYEQVRPFCYL